MKAGRLALILIGAIVGSVALGLVIAGAGLGWVWTTDRSPDGFIASPELTLETDQFAIISPAVDLGARPGDWFPSGRLGAIRITVDQSEIQPVFIGVGPTADVDAYLEGVGVTEPRRITDRGVTDYDVTTGSAIPASPVDQSFWVATNAGATGEELEWELTQGEWTLVLMNADGSAGIDAEVTAAAAIDFIPLVVAGLVVGGLLLGGIAIALLLAGVAAGRGREPAAVAPATGIHPVRLEAELDPHLSRGLWLVKWFLAIPHYVILGFLGVAAVLLTIVAGVAILFTGRYPRGIFDFNVGVMRWAWRVGYYATTAIGTDRYPPFTMEPTDYPATLEIVYPDSLSRGLVLVKWLLAIPHLLIVGVLTNGVTWWTQELAGGDTTAQVGAGLIGLMVLVAGFALLFTGRYPQPLFDLLIGLNRWVYRVVAYVALMTDEYPPFRLDQGGSEPPASPGPTLDPSDTRAQAEMSR